MGATIRFAGLADLQEILRLNLAIFEHERQFGDTYDLGWTYGEVGNDYFRERLGNDRAIVLVAELEKAVVGYALTHLGSYAYRVVNPIAEIENMAVDPPFRGQGIGTQLVEKSRSIAQERGARRVRVGVIAQNVRAIAFYRAALGVTDFEVYLEADL